MKYIVFILLMTALYSCKEPAIADLFLEKQTWELSEFKVETDSLVYPYMLSIVADTFLVVHDPYNFKHFTAYELETGKYYTRFGNIGSGPKEILFGSIGFPFLDKYMVYNESDKRMLTYDLKTMTILPAKKLSSFSHNLFLNRIYTTNDSLFIVLGLYNEKYQYTLINMPGQVLDYAVEIFCNSNNTLNAAQKSLSTQGILNKHPHDDKYVSTLYYSSNIDFITLKDHKINITKSLHYGDPDFKGNIDGSSIDIADNCLLGFLDIAVTAEYIYALYSNKRYIQDGVDSEYSSTDILVFDWEGNPIKQIVLNQEIYFLAVSKTNNAIWGIGKTKEGDFTILKFEPKIE